jgi:hypothetical protein
MKRKVSQPWNMASVRSRQTPRVYKTCGPVAHPYVKYGLSGLEEHCCGACGHHVCSCERHCKIPLRDVTDDWIQANAPVPPSPGPVGPQAREYNFPVMIDLEDGRAPNHPDFANAPAFVLNAEKAEPVCTCTHARGAIMGGDDHSIKCASCFRPFPQEE